MVSKEPANKLLLNTKNKIQTPGIIISALKGGSGKTFISIGVMAAWRAAGYKIGPFKKGPDYIDAGWLTLAAARTCHNLDMFLIPPQEVINSFVIHSQNQDIALVEGNRGLYDGIDTQGSTSTAELSKLLGLPVILCLDCTKATRTMAALLMGCRAFDPEVKIKGVILNRVAGPRHEAVVRNNIATHCNIPVLGALPKLNTQDFPERHMGLVPTPEHGWAQDSIAAAAKIAQEHIDLKKLFDMAAVTPLTIKPKPALSINPAKPKIGIIKDAAFQFYYPENIEALQKAGAELIMLSPLAKTKIPALDGLYIGGGFPETHAAELVQNQAFKEQLKALAQKGLPIYAECGGLIYLSTSLKLDQQEYPMAGVLPIKVGFSKKPQGHGYTVLKVVGQNPYFKIGTQIKGHEFHYSKIIEFTGHDDDLVFAMQRGHGFKACQHENRDGVCYKNVLATYTHIHALGCPQWAASLVAVSISYKKKPETNEGLRLLNSTY